MKELNIKNRKFILVEVPEEYHMFKISGTNYLCGAENTAWQAIPPRLEQGWVYNIIGLIDELKHNDVKDLVDSNHNLYRDFMFTKLSNLYSKETSLESFISLLQYKEIDTTKKLLLIEKFERHEPQTIQELADRFYTRYGNNDDEYNHSSNVYNKRLCEQVRNLIEYHVSEALKIANVKAKAKVKFGGYLDNNTILNAYPKDNIK
jgi:hypothetical protein